MGRIDYRTGYVYLVDLLIISILFILQGVGSKYEYSKNHSLHRSFSPVLFLSKERKVFRKR